MLFNVIPQDIFLAPIQQIPAHVRRRRQAPDMEFLRRLGLAPGLKRPEGCCRGRMSRDGCPRLNPKTAGCCQKPVSSKHGTSNATKQTTVEKSSVDFRGFSPEQIRVKVTDKSVMIRGEQKNDHTNVQITKSVPLPEGVDRKNIVCRYEDGLVTVHFPVTQQKHLEKSPEMIAEVEGRKEQEDVDSRRKAEVERSLKTLTDLFSNLFGLHLVESAAEGENQGEGGKCEGEKCETKKCETEPEMESKESEEGNTSEDSSIAEGNTQCIDPVSSTPSGEEEQTLVMTTNEEESKSNEDDGFVHVETQEAAVKVVVEFPGSDEEDDVTAPMTSLEVDVMEAENDEETVAGEPAEQPSEKSELTEPKVFKLELDLSSYTPEEIRVVFKDGDVMVEAEREVKGDNYSETEKLSRRIRVPENVDESMFKSYRSEEGLLTIQAPYKKCESNSRVIKVNLED